MKFDHVAFNVKCIHDSVEWYKKHLNCDVLHKDDTWAMIKCGNTKIALTLPSQHPSHVAFEVSSSAVIPCDKDKIKVHRDGSSYYYGSDPDGNIIEWLAYPESGE
jgi:catechol-2,3-dioxygenase